MAQAVKYKKPRRINIVSVSLALFVAVSGYLAYQYLPLYLQKQEAYRVLEETGSGFAGRSAYYFEDRKATEALRRKMEGELRRVGIGDPNLESWIDLEGSEARFGALYSVWLSWPFDLIERQEFVYEIEHLVKT